MRSGLPRAAAALAVFAGWVVVTIFSSRLWSAVVVPQSIDQTVSTSVQLSLAAAILFLLVCIAAFRWNDLGFAAPRPLRSLRLLWFPALYVVAFLALATAVGFPPAPATLIILANTAMAGVSEELACRGVLYQGLRSRLSVWPAILLSTFLFGAVHVLNGISTGSFTLAAVQAVAAFMTGIAFMAIRVRTGSLYPGMVLHGVWDFTLLVSVTGLIQRYGIPDASSLSGPASAALALPVLLVVPNFLYGLYLLRRAGRDAGP
jgi:membrane protease YdiL (CAAX protease family)